MPVEETTGSIISRDIPKLSSDPVKLAAQLQLILRHHHQDIKTLEAQCTDNDLQEKKARDNFQA